MEYRIESDFLGKVKVPKDAYYGPETSRALENFPISGASMPHEFIKAYAMLKKAAAIANAKAGALDKNLETAICKACNEIISGKLMDQFPVDRFQAGAGTMTNMNLNEVIANRALELCGRKKGDYSYIHPNDKVNMSQSTNDTFHCAIHIASVIAIQSNLIPSLKRLRSSLLAKARNFSKITKLGRTHLQDAVPIKLGSEFSGYSGSIDIALEEIFHAYKQLLKLPLGGTAVGTGLNASKGYQENAIAALKKITGISFSRSTDIFTNMQNILEEAYLAAALKSAAIAVRRISDDIRLLSSGPRGGLAEIILPEVEPGSSIMPGKVNPSMAEMMGMVCMQVEGNCYVVESAAQAGQLELNVFMPVAAANILDSIRIFSSAVDAFNKKCVSGIKPNMTKIKENLERNLSIATALSPYIGYSRAADIARKAFREGKTVKEVCLELGVMEKDKLDSVLDPDRQS
ncbi:MAG: aspartate ammonia-lyase [Candidatus Micrarchaeaceae archaeon]